MLVDVHAHLDFPEFSKDLDRVVSDAEKVGVSNIITSGVNQEANKKALAISKKYKIVDASLGLYPLDILDLSEEDLSACFNFIEQHKKEFVAIGEVGLDFVSGYRNKEQKENFFKIMELVEKLKKPIIVHSRKAEKDVIEMLESSKIKKILLHCFSGSMKLVKRAEDNGWMFSIPTNVVYSQHFQTLAQRVSINNLLTETDSPFLSPVRGERNEPKNVSFTVKKISEIKKLDEGETKKIIFMNFKNIFR